MNTYWEVIARIDGRTEVLYGSFDREDCIDEVDAEGESWLFAGFRNIKIRARCTTQSPDPEVYGVSEH